MPLNQLILVTFAITIVCIKNYSVTRLLWVHLQFLWLHHFLLLISNFELQHKMNHIFREDLNLDPVKMVSRLLKNALICPEKECVGGNQIQNLAYGRRETIIASMAKSKMIDLIFTLSSSSSDRKLFDPSRNDVSAIFEDILCIISTIFDGIEISDLFKKNAQQIANDIDSGKIRKPIRHGRFSGSVSVQLSVISDFLQIF